MGYGNENFERSGGRRQKPPAFKLRISNRDGSACEEEGCDNTWNAGDVYAWPLPGEGARGWGFAFCEAHGLARGAGPLTPPSEELTILRAIAANLGLELPRATGAPPTDAPPAAKADPPAAKAAPPAAKAAPPAAKAAPPARRAGG